MYMSRFFGSYMYNNDIIIQYKFLNSLKEGMYTIKKKLTIVDTQGLTNKGKRCPIRKFCKGVCVGEWGSRLLISAKILIEINDIVQQKRKGSKPWNYLDTQYLYK